MPTSIKRKLIIFYTAVPFLILSALGVFLYFGLSKVVYDSVDAVLLSKAQTLTTLVNDDEEDRTELRSSEEFKWDYNSPKSRSFFQIRRLDGYTLEKSASLKDFELPYTEQENQTDFKNIRLNGVYVRLINYYVPEINNKASISRGQNIVIQCAKDIQDQTDLLQHYRIILSLSIFAIMIISAIGGVIILNKSLTPVKDISATIGRISESNLSARIRVNDVPKELQIIASSFNRAIDKLENAFRVQRQFTADASHELRTPLAVIMSQSEVALRKERTKDEYKSALTDAMESAEKMSATVQKLLSLARLSADTINFNQDTINISDIIRDSVRLVRPLCDQKSIHVEVHQLSEPALVRGDRAALLELFANLLDNAIKYNVPHGTIHVSISKEAEFIVCIIQDTGIGIPEEDLAKVFQRFYRVDQARSKKIDGNGLGLSICDEIVKLHHGRIEIKSALGKGTVLSVYLKELEDLNLRG
jgi:heavy metal sensor kinase